MTRKNKKCLMIETPDKKKFFTHSKNYNEILDFAQNFNCEISRVQLEEGQILDLVPLAEAISCKDNSKGAKFALINIEKPRKYNRKKK